MKNPHAKTVTSEKGKKDVCEAIGVVDLDISEDGILQDNQTSPSTGVKTSSLRPVQDSEFEIVQLDDNPNIRSVYVIIYYT